MDINSKTKLIGLLGHPVGHSVSPCLQNALAEYSGCNLRYMAFDIPEGKLGEAIKGLYAIGGVGFNVTVPYKKEVMQYLVSIDEKAETIGAVNTLKRSEKGFIGYNTDMPGLMRAMEYDRVEVKGRPAVLLGAGGAANAALAALSEQKAKVIVIVNRSVEKADALADRFRDKYPDTKILTAPLSTDVSKVMKEISNDKSWVALQSSSVGMYPDTENAVITDDEFYGLIDVGYDVIFNPEKTKFMRLVEENGGRSFNGLKMLLFQGIRSFEIWNEVSITDEIVEELLEKLGKALKA